MCFENIVSGEGKKDREKIFGINDNKNSIKNTTAPDVTSIDDIICLKQRGRRFLNVLPFY